ncbi:pyridoxamine 5'-phosphate oxidase family protein [Cobetia sp. LC6]|uniref:2Fe-2S iron-sulfur cluster-binding protein n=1 Tax=Cobetia sp. LC6 TaxID=3050947 RepID=UPI002555FC95|nr:pyridoxamine 5'-phosphate oxidase family protein [Cobetia sp. LC6]MDL2191320.1 pyridoxamine 5'-phosphate oxidase family protein [Cobetia sp. LC6]
MSEHCQVFHAGERRVQARAGVSESYVDQVAPYVRDQMPEQHVAFFESLPVLFMGVPDTQGWPWAVVSFAAPGQLCDATPGELKVHARPALGQLLGLEFTPGTRIGVLGLDLASRRRNRMNGTLLAPDAVADMAPAGLRIGVDQSFGNCPQYIQQREVDWAGEQAKAPVSREVSLDAEAALNDEATWNDEEVRALLAQADTFFIATRAGELDEAAPNGVDVSHRGGRPGFLHLNADGSLSFPDFAGNRFFNTLGNIELDSRVSLLIPDFITGEALIFKGHARIDWNPQRAALVEGAERIVDVVPEQILHVAHVLPAQGRLIERSPALEQTGDWPAADESPLSLRRLRVIDKVRESEVITSFYLAPWPEAGPEHEPAEIDAYQAGQFLTLRLASTPDKLLTCGEIPVMRSYSISQAWRAGHGAYRISVRRDPKGLASRLLHDEIAVGDVLEAAPPAGNFVLQDSPAPIVLLSSGVGITPMIAMLDTLVQQAEAGHPPHGEVFFLHAARDGGELAFAEVLNVWARGHAWLHVHIALSRPSEADLVAGRHQSEGRLELVSLAGSLPGLASSHVYLCGSEGFMRAQYAALMALGLPRERLHHEFFGLGSLEQRDTLAVAQSADFQASLPERTQVTFTPRVAAGQSAASAAGITRQWTPEQGSLLELAEQSGVNTLSSCRSGRCGSCALRLIEGEIKYPEPPQAGVAQGQVLMCCAYPAGEAPLVIQTL